jgi:hypothetical protein
MAETLKEIVAELKELIFADKVDGDWYYVYWDGNSTIEYEEHGMLKPSYESVDALRKQGATVLPVTIIERVDIDKWD